MTEQERDAIVRETVERCAAAIKETPVQFTRGRLDGRATLAAAEQRLRELLKPSAWYA